MRELKSLDKAFYKSLGMELSKIRKCKGISLKKVGQELSCSTQMADNFELGNNRLSEKKFEQICDLLEIEPTIEVTVKFIESR